MSGTPHEPLNYERVRSELAERGYLGGRVERFVLQGWPGDRPRFPPQLVRTALKAALLGAPVLALLVAATVARDNRPLIAARDFPLILFLIIVTKDTRPKLVNKDRTSSRLLHKK